MPNINPRDMNKIMKRMGVKQEEIQATEVIIKANDKDIIIENPKVTKVNMLGQESFQISGEIVEKEKELFSKEDVKTVMQQTDCKESEAIEALKETNDLAEAIIKLKK